MLTKPLGEAPILTTSLSGGSRLTIFDTEGLAQAKPCSEDSGSTNFDLEGLLTPYLDTEGPVSTKLLGEALASWNSSFEGLAQAKLRSEGTDSTHFDTEGLVLTKLLGEAPLLTMPLSGGSTLTNVTSSLTKLFAEGLV